MLVDIFFMIDIVLNFFTGYEKDGILVLEPASIARNYATS